MSDARDLPPLDPAEPVCFHGGPPGTRVALTSSPWGPIRTVHVPDEEIVLGPDAFHARLPDPGEGTE